MLRSRSRSALRPAAAASALPVERRYCLCGKRMHPRERFLNAHFPCESRCNGRAVSAHLAALPDAPDEPFGDD